MNKNFNQIKEVVRIIKVPDEMDQVVKNALYHRTKKQYLIRKPILAFSSLILCVMLLFAYSYDTLAYFGKKLTGYENVAYGPVEKLIETGKGQIINQKITLSDGKTFTLEGIIFNENNGYIFYKIQSEEPIDHISFQYPRLTLKGLWKEYYMQSGSGELIDPHTIVGVETKEIPHFYEKWMHFELEYERLTHKINFTLDRNEAYISTIKAEYSKKIVGDNYLIHFEQINISDFEVVVKGKMEITSKELMDLIKANKYTPTISFDLYGENQLIEKISGNGYSTHVENDKIEIKFERTYYIEQPIKNFEIKNIYYGVVIKDITEIGKKFIAIHDGLVNETIAVGIKISSVKTENNLTIITLTSQNDFKFTLQNEENQISYELKRIVNQDTTYTYEITYDSNENVKLLVTEIGSYYYINQDFNIK